MTVGKFELLGHDNPLGRYPAPVVPVGRLDGSMVVVYATQKSGQELVHIDEDVEYVRLEAAMRDMLAGFDYLHHRLFAYDEKHVRYYSIKKERKFFEEILQAPIIEDQDPFFRLSLAKGSKVAELVRKEMVSCLKELNSEGHAAAVVFTDSWYQAQRKSLSKQRFLGRSVVPRNWRQLVENESTPLTAGVFAWNFVGLLSAIFLALGMIVIALLFFISRASPVLIQMVTSMGAIGTGVVIVLGIMSVYSIAIVVERYLTYAATKKQSREFVLSVAHALQNDRLEEAINISDKHRKSHLAMVVSSGLQEFRAHEGSSDISGDEIEASKRALQRAIAIKTAEFKRGLSGLSIIGSTAPFVGLFGTVVGIINAFNATREVGQVGIGTVAAGISEALFTTALGLLVAVPAVWLSNYFTTKVDGFVNEMQNTATEVENYIKQRATNVGAQQRT